MRAEGEGFEYARGGRGRRERGEYGFSSLLKQKIKGKILLRHLQRRNFFFINYILFYVTKCLRSKKKKKKLNGSIITTSAATTASRTARALARVAAP